MAITQYDPHPWADAELITAKKLNDIELALQNVTKNAITLGTSQDSTQLDFYNIVNYKNSRDWSSITESVLAHIYGNTDFLHGAVVFDLTNNVFSFRQYSPTNTSTSSYDNYKLPAPSTEVGNYEILTTKTTGSIVSQLANTNVSIADSTPITIASITLSQGTWLIIGRCSFNNNATGFRWIGISSNENSVNANDLVGDKTGEWRVPAVTGAWTVGNVMAVVSPTADTTYYLNALQTSGATLGVNGTLRAVRIT